MTSLGDQEVIMNITEMDNVTVGQLSNGTFPTWFNETIPGNNTITVCVMCRYYLDPWVKAIRVGFGSCIVLANMVTFVLLLRSKTLQMALRYFLLNVAVVDGLYGFGFLYHSAIVDFPQFIVMNLECKLRYGMLCMVSMVALFTLMAMCVERVIALKFAFSYHLIITRRNLLIGLVFFWAIPASIVTPTYILMDSSVGECNFVRFISAESFVVFAVSYFAFMIIAVLCQLILLCITKSHIRKIIPTIVGDARERAEFKMNLKATSTTLALAVPFVICATPKVLTYMYLAFNPRERIKLESITMLAVTVYLNVSNSLINPLLYCWRLADLRNQILAIFRRRGTSSFASSDPAHNGGSICKKDHHDNEKNEKRVSSNPDNGSRAGTGAEKVDEEKDGKKSGNGKPTAIKKDKTESTVTKGSSDQTSEHKAWEEHTENDKGIDNTVDGNAQPVHGEHIDEENCVTDDSTSTESGKSYLDKGKAPHWEKNADPAAAADSPRQFERDKNTGPGESNLWGVIL